ncbi:MAG: hypothetical protein IJO33_04015 [Bacilli bacterium]|nr:hypothetical protein [Bacilli bacterium]
MDVEIYLNTLLDYFMFFVPLIILLIILNCQLKKEIIAICGSKEKYKEKLKSQKQQKDIVLKVLNIIQLTLIIVTLVGLIFLFKITVIFCGCFLFLFIAEGCPEYVFSFFYIIKNYVSLLFVLASLLLGKSLYIKYKIKDALVLTKK